MNFTPLEEIILKHKKQNRSAKEGARRLKMPIAEYLNAKAVLNLKLMKHYESVPLQSSTSTPEGIKMVENNVNLDAGTSTLRGIVNHEVLSPEEVEVLFKIDKSRWKLSSFWNKAQANGTFLLSANITQLKGREISLDDVQSVIKKVFKEMNLEQIPTHGEGESNGKALFVYTSDKHVGAFVSGEALYPNEYNKDVFADRMVQLLNEILYYKSIYGHFEDIFIIDLGDSMDGLDAMTTRKGHKLPQNMSNKEAFEAYLSVHKNFFDSLLSYKISNRTHFICCTNDNHAGDFGYFTNRALEEYLNARYPDVGTKMFTKFIDHILYGKHVVLLCHGKDDEDRKFGLPRHIDEKTTNYIDKYLREYKIDPRESIVHFRKGDLHLYNNEQTLDFDYKNVLSMFGGSKWIGHNFGPTRAGTSMEVIEMDTYRVYEANCFHT